MKGLKTDSEKRKKEFENKYGLSVDDFEIIRKIEMLQIKEKIQHRGA